MTTDELDQLGYLAGTLGAEARVFHSGWVVADLDRATASLAEALGVVFTEPVTADLTCGTPEGEIAVSLRFSYSTRGAHVELIEEVPGTVWDTRSPVAGRHVGFWASDPNRAAARLDERGFERLVWSVDADGTLLFSYHATPFGLHLEVVNEAGKLFYPSWFTSTDPSLQVSGEGSPR